MGRRFCFPPRVLRKGLQPVRQLRVVCDTPGQAETIAGWRPARARKAASPQRVANRRSGSSSSALFLHLRAPAGWRNRTTKGRRGISGGGAQRDAGRARRLWNGDILVAPPGESPARLGCGGRTTRDQCGRLWFDCRGGHFGFRRTGRRGRELQPESSWHLRPRWGQIQHAQ